MTYLWPRLPAATAEQLFDRVARTTPAADFSHPEQTWGEVGTRVGQGALEGLRRDLAAAAEPLGFPGRRPTVSERGRFDRLASRVLREAMDVTYAEASAAGVWAFSALVLLPDLTAWRWSNSATPNRERWIYVDVTRHTWSRCWWLAEGFGDEFRLMDGFGESELNQIFERHSIGSRPRLLRTLAPLLLAAYDEPDVPRRLVTREVGKRLVRQLAYLDPYAMGDEELGEWCTDVVAVTVQQVRSRPDVPELTD